MCIVHRMILKTGPKHKFAPCPQSGGTYSSVIFLQEKQNKVYFEMILVLIGRLVVKLLIY